MNNSKEKSEDLYPGLTQEQKQTAISSPEQLKAFLIASDRKWLVLNTSELVDSLIWPEGVNQLMQMIEYYSKHRACIETGDPVLAEEGNPLSKEDGSPLMQYKQEALSKVELDQAIRFLVKKITELDSDWSLKSPAL